MRYVVAGSVNTSVTYVAYLVLLRFLPYGVAYSLAFAAGIGIAYVLQARFVFHASMSWGNLFAFPLIYVAQYAIGGVLLAWLVETGRASRELALFAVLLVTVPIGFVSSRALFAFEAHRRRLKRG